MWLAEGFSSDGISAIVVAAITAIGGVIAMLLRRRPAEDADEAVNAGVEASTSALAEVLVKKNARIERLERLLDEAYQGGFVPRPRPAPHGGQHDRD